MASPSEKQAPASTTPFAASVESLPDMTIVHLAGSCTMMESQRLADELIKAASHPRPLVLIDMAGLDFITSNGLGSIVAGFLRCRRQQGEMWLVGPRPAIHELLQLTRLTALFKVYDSLDAARAAAVSRSP